ncbi:MAG: hypothetical protein ABR502_05095 [Chitinophagaceae bacterium]
MKIFLTITLLLTAVIFTSTKATIISSPDNASRSLHPSLKHSNITPPDHKKAAFNKLNLLHKFYLKILLKKLKKQNIAEEEITERQKKLGKLSLIFGLISIPVLLLGSVIGAFSLLAIPAAIIAIVLGIKSIKGNSNTRGLIGLISGSVTILLLLLGLIIALIFYSSWQ